MDAGNQTAAVSFLHQTAANLGGIETNAPDFTPSLLELLFGNNRPQVKVPFYCCEIGLTETRERARLAVCRDAPALCAVCGAVASERGQSCLPGLRYPLMSQPTGDLPTTSLTLSNWSANRGTSHLPQNGRIYSKLRWKHLCLIYGADS